MTGNISELERHEVKERNMRDYFAEDNFKARRGGAGPSNYGNAYDPESLITGAEIAAGKTYYDKRQWPNEHYRRDIVAGRLSIETLPIIAPR